MTIFKSIFGNSEQSPVKNNNVLWNHLTDLNQLDDLIAHSKETPVLIFKHSTQCSVSRMALKQFENDFDLSFKVTPYFLDLIAFRLVSNAIAEKFQVAHQSPQLLLIKNGVSVYDVSHNAIDAADLKSKL
ncbi:MAG: bacillithiol system redox-active protein YtxJ [Burkholderiales bacterium]|nr:bacillithiol system redox-active protein YtxJ [Flavobacterium sp.]